MIAIINIPIQGVVFLGFGLSLLSIRVFRFFEYEADKFSIERVDNPQGVITAQEKFRKVDYGKMTWLNAQESIGRNLLHWNISSAERIKMAKKREF